MIELSIVELLYLVATFFLIIIGTLLSLVLFRVLKILKVGTEIADYYWQMKKLLMYYAGASYVMKDKIFDMFAGETQKPESEEEKKSSV